MKDDLASFVRTQSARSRLHSAKMRSPLCQAPMCQDANAQSRMRSVAKAATNLYFRAANILRRYEVQFLTLWPKQEYFLAETSRLFDYKQKLKGFMPVEQFYASIQTADGDLKATSSDADSGGGGSDGYSQSLLVYDRLVALEDADPLAYKPGEGDLADFDVPEDLPELTGWRRL